MGTVSRLVQCRTQFIMCDSLDLSFTLTVPYAITANIGHFYKCLSFLYGVAVRWNQALLDSKMLRRTPIGQKNFCINSLDIIVQWSVVDRT